MFVLSVVKDWEKFCQATANDKAKRDCLFGCKFNGLFAPPIHPDRLRPNGQEIVLDCG